MKVNDGNRLRHMMFQKSSENNLRKLPPTKDSLKMHVLRSAYDAGWMWGSILQGRICIPSAIEWGWKYNADRQIVPAWCNTSKITLDDYLFTCTCKNICTRCRCAIKNQSCLPYCKCQCLVHVNV